MAEMGYAMQIHILYFLFFFFFSTKSQTQNYFHYVDRFCWSVFVFIL